MFLKQIKLQGFKSFANKTIINFESDFTGIVGPNGCGKSNIIDAIKWVLGEQSAKSLRGSSMSDVVFAGSAEKRGVGLAEVTLVFDNSNHQLNSEYQEVEVTRKLYKDSNESEYLINGTECRLKDVIDLTLDTGLGKDSLSTISQNTITNFSEAKPIERRALFEEAAGVAKYKKRKEESLSKLNRTQDNIDRLNDIVAELERQVNPLKRQAYKAEQYLEKKKRLTEIEVAVIVNAVNTINNDLQTIEQQLFDLDYRETTTKAQIQILENTSSERKDEIAKIDNEVQGLQDKLLKILEEIQTLERNKAKVDERRKYIQETGTTAQQIEETKKLLDTYYQEYQDRLKRVEALDANIELLTNTLNDNNVKLNDVSSSLEKAQSRFNSLNTKKSVLENLIKSPFENQAGVNTVIKNKNVLEGIEDAVSNLFIPDEGYQQMVTIALGNGLYHIVTKDVKSAKEAIRFLKKNKAGNATFLPMDILRPRYVNKDHLFICENTEGYLGQACDFVDCKEEYDVVVMSLLGNILVADTLDHAHDLAKRLNYGYKIVTLDGDVIYKGGTLSGGYNHSVESPLTYRNQLDEINKQLADLTLDISSLNAQKDKLNKDIDNASSERVTAKVSLASMNEIVAVKRDKYEKEKEIYDRIRPDQKENEVGYEDELTASLSKAYATKDEITATISKKRERRIEANNEYQRKYLQLKQVRNELNDIIDQSGAIQIEKAKLNANKDNQLERLARDYSLTFDYANSQTYDVDLDSAKEEVVSLRNEIQELGNINLDAPESFAEVNERYEHMNTQLNDLIESRTKLLSAISEMDDTMSSQFSEMFDKINDSLSEVFTVLFGGGKAKLFYEDPNDILNTGIDIDVQPPGKSIQNIKLFSGGEKSLIAICVLFAILKARPVPLCIFDEVEASLDPGNVDRFAKYIHKFSKDTQFLVITHRPGTMTECDVLFGVTMQQKGISNILKVKLKDAMEISEKDKKDESVQ